MLAATRTNVLHRSDQSIEAVVNAPLCDGFMRPIYDGRPASKNRKTIKEAIQMLQKTLEEDDTAFVAMQNVVEQAHLKFRFPDETGAQSPPCRMEGRLAGIGI
jgi:hypothetical protein